MPDREGLRDDALTLRRHPQEAGQRHAPGHPADQRRRPQRQCRQADHRRRRDQDEERGHQPLRPQALRGDAHQQQRHHQRPEQQPDAELRRSPLGMTQLDAGHRHQHIADHRDDQHRRDRRPLQAAGAVAGPPARQHPDGDRELAEAAGPPDGRGQRAGAVQRHAQRAQQDQRHRQGRDEGMAHRMAQVLRPGFRVALQPQHAQAGQHQEDRRGQPAQRDRQRQRRLAHQRHRAPPGQRQAGQAHDDREPGGREEFQCGCGSHGAAL